jgi:hypothetical protein
MALGLSPLSPATAGGLGSLGGRKVWVGYIVFDSSYPSGGYVADPTLFGMAQIDQVLSGVLSSLNQVCKYTPAAGGVGKFQVFTASTGVELVNTTNLSGATAPVIVFGI